MTMTARAKRARTTRLRRRSAEVTYEGSDSAQIQLQSKIGQHNVGNQLIPRKCQINAHVQKQLDIFVDTFTTFGVDGLRKQFKNELALYRAPDNIYKFEAFEANPDKNRCQDVVCLDDTRVHLTLDVPPSTDYIHANWVKFEGHDKVFIATQSPLDNTIEDFWRMVYQEGCPHIVNLSTCMENGEAAGPQYWPLQPGQYNTYGKMFVNTKKVESEGKYTVYTVEVLPDGCSNSNIVKHHIYNLQLNGFPMIVSSSRVKGVRMVIYVRLVHT
ncbi:Protein-tyrosine phosphatase [Dictyocaulus viviparus]|uniref:Protein-tyrosine phosphatase n=1 Tax=Dictyocaulus viviparus TaxID=29172 RepID=A0A0D8Y1T5_DICVI|nr:Protein-tyrosine phosphatase [Dictyocaulus viviparus]